MSTLEIILLTICLLCQTAYIVYRLDISKKRFVRKADIIELEDEVASLSESFKKFRSRHLMRFLREEREEEQKQIYENLPTILEKLPIDENTKNIIKNIPPDILETIIKKLFR